jgi:hypothetical protein
LSTGLCFPGLFPRLGLTFPIFISSCRFGGVASIRAAICRVVSSRSVFFTAMTKDFPPKESDAVRGALLNAPGSALYAHLGYFLMWYAVAEVSITTMMAFVLDFRNL